MSNNCTNLTSLLKNNCVVYFISACAVSIIKIVLKISLSNVDAKDRKFEVYEDFIAIDFKVDPMPKYLLFCLTFIKKLQLFL